MMLLRARLYRIFGRFQYLKYIARYIVYYMDKWDLSVPDHRRGEFQAFIYMMRETEWEIPLKRHLDLEVDSRINTFLFIVPVQYEWCNVELGTEDLPWFLRQNRYRINKSCSGPWYYENFKYYFKTHNDMESFKVIARKYKFMDN